MDMLAPIVRHVIGPAWATWEGSPYLRTYRSLVKSQYRPIAEVKQAQWQAARAKMLYAYENVPFYRGLYDQTGVHPSDIQEPGDFVNVPLVTKKHLRSEQKRMLADGIDPAKCNVKETSGSTGVSVKVLVDEAAHQWKRAATIRSDEWSGWRFGKSVAKLWSPDDTQLNWRTRLRSGLLDRSTILDTQCMDAEGMQGFLDHCRRNPPGLLFGHAHSVHLFAEFAERNGGAQFVPGGILTTAMVLHDWERAQIERTFGCRVTNRYGCEEISLLACQCEQSQGLHINAEGVYVEIIRPDGSHAAPGEAGRVVVTDLQNVAMPMVRYEIGDTAVMGGEPCRCGRGLPVLERIAGRIADYIVSPAGRWVSGITMTDSFGTLHGMAQLQVVQHTLETLTFRIVRGPDYGEESERALAARFAEFFGDTMHYELEFVDRIDPEPSGKYRFCISHVSSQMRPERSLVLQ